MQGSCQKFIKLYPKQVFYRENCFVKNSWRASQDNISLSLPLSPSISLSFFQSVKKHLSLKFLREIKEEEHKILSGQALLLHTVEQLQEIKISS